MNILHTTSKYPIGIDISDSAIKLAQLKRSGHNITIQAISRIGLPEEIIKFGVIKKQAELVGFLKKAIKETIAGKITSQEAIICLPETKTFTKLIEIKNSNPNINDVILDEIEKNIPYQIKEVNHDWQTMRKDKNSSEILISATPKKIADSYYNVTQEAGLTPVALEPEPLAITRALLPLNQRIKNTVVIIDIGTKYANFIAHANGSVLFTSSIPTSGDNITKAISEKLKISGEQAESAKIVCGLNQEEIKEVIEKELAQKIKKIFTYLTANYPKYSQVSNIYLCGGGAYIKGFSEALSGQLKINTEKGNIFTNISLNQKKENQFFSKEFVTSKKLTPENKVTRNFSLIFATAIGLAIRGAHYEI